MFSHHDRCLLESFFLIMIALMMMVMIIITLYYNVNNDFERSNSQFNCQILRHETVFYPASSLRKVQQEKCFRHNIGTDC